MKIVTKTVEQQPQFYQDTGRRETTTTTTTIFIVLLIQKCKDIKRKWRKRTGLSLRKQLTFCNVEHYWFLLEMISVGQLQKVYTDDRNSILMTCHCPDLGSAFDCFKQIFLAAQPIRSTTQILVVTISKEGISVLVSQTPFHRATPNNVDVQGKSKMVQLTEEQYQITRN